MMLIRRIIAVLCLAWVCLPVFAQKYSFSTKPSAFIVDIGTYVSGTKNEGAIATFERFQTLWNDGTLVEARKKEFIACAILMEKKKLKKVPYLTNLMDQYYHAFVTRTLSQSQMDSLVFTNIRVVNNYKSKDLDNYFRLTNGFLEEKIIFSNPKITWYANTDDFIFVWAEPKPEPEEPEEPEESEASEDNWEDADGDGWGDNVGDAFDDWDADPGEDWSNTAEESNVSNEEEGYNDEMIDALYGSIEIPENLGPVLKLKKVDLTLVTDGDSVTLYQTDGSISTKSYNFVGTGGSFDWSSAGLPKEVNIDLDKFFFNIRKPAITAENVMMNYPSKITEPVKGIFEYRHERNLAPERRKYPRFMSYKSKVELKDLGENLKYKGGFSLEGQRVSSSSVSEGLCYIDVFYEGEEKFRAVSKNFYLSDSLVQSKLAKIVIYEHEDSLYSQAASFEYNENTQALKVERDPGAFKNTPFVDHHHGLEIHVDAILWNLKDTTMEFTQTNAKNERAAYFNSMESFSQQEYVQLKGLYPFHPLQMISNYYRLTKKEKFYVGDVAKKFKQNEKTVANAMKALMRKGYIEFNPRGGEIKFTDKARHYVLSHRGKKDFDIISIKSVDPPTTNAHLDVNNNVLIVEGVDQFRLSDSSHVICYPKNRKIKIVENRGIEFDGMVTTTGYQFNGRNFVFDYDKFQMELNNIDSIKFTVQVRDSITGRVKGRKTLQNKLSYSSGTLTIDAPDNKSGKVSYPNFPHFDANKGASVVFNQDDVLGSAYDTTVRYKIPPFDIDSLDNSIEGNVSFDGTFVSGDIFPEFEEKLKVMEDLSFGFVHETPEEGYPLYNSDARFIGTISMNKQGIRGNGTITYLNTTIESPDFVFYLDSVMAIAHTVTSEPGPHPLADEGVTYPNMNVTQCEVVWESKRDSMYISSLAEPLELYKDGTQLNGFALLTPEGLYASGMMESEGALTISNKFHLEENKFTGNEAQFEIQTEIPAKPAMKSDFVKVEVDFENSVAFFSPEKQGIASTVFPYLQYSTSLDEGTWDIKGRKVTLTKPVERPLDSSYFVSTRKDQLGLSWNAEEATYYMDSLKLHVNGVPGVKVADAEVFPDQGKMVIGENAIIETLKEAKILIDTVNQYHTLIHGEIDFVSKNEFQGRAIYQFINFDQDTLKIQFNKFELVEQKIDKKTSITQTVSNGVVLEEDTFVIAPKMIYKGNVTMFASQKQLSFDGFIKLDIKGVIESPNWLKYKSKEGEEGIQIEIKDQKASDGKPLITGIHFSNRTKNYYCTFLNTLKSVTDKSLLLSSGFLSQDVESGVFQIGELDVLQGKSYEGNVFGYNERDETFSWRGKVEMMNPDMDGNLEAQIHYASFGQQTARDTVTTLAGLALVNFNIPSPLYDIMGEDIAEMAYLLASPKTIDLNDTLLVNIANLSSNKAAQKYNETAILSYQPLFKADKALSEGIVLNDLHMEYIPEHRSWISVDSFGVANVLKKDVNSKVGGFLEIHKASTGDRVHLYIILDEKCWYYFEYLNNTLTAISSNQDFNDYIESKSTMEKNQLKGLYYYTIADPSQKSRFLKQYGEKFLNGVVIEDPRMDDYEIESGFEDELDESFEDELDAIEEEDAAFDEELDALDEEESFDEGLDAIGEDEDALDEGLDALGEEEDDFDSALDSIESEDNASDDFDSALDGDDDGNKKKKRKKDK